MGKSTNEMVMFNSYVTSYRRVYRPPLHCVGYESHDLPINMFLQVTMLHGEIQLPSGKEQVANENCHLQLIYPLRMVIFHSYVSLPEGKSNWLETAQASNQPDHE